MRGAFLILTVVCGLGIPVRGWPQHATGTALDRVKPDYVSCALCHDAHTPAATAYTLRVSALPLVVTGPKTRSPELDAISQSCLRCHLTPEMRDRQPEFDRGAITQGSQKAFLGFDLGDDHPVGYVERNLAPVSARNSRDADFPSSAFRSAHTRGLTATEHLSCTACHDPHDRNSSLARPEEQVVLCTGCHASGTYALGAHAALACGDCHRMHSGAGRLLAERLTDAVCNACHQPAGVPAARPDSRRLPQAPAGHDRLMGDSCLSCHGAHQ